MEIFAQRLKELREENNLSLRKLAKELLVDDTTIGRLEKQLRIPNILELKKIAIFFKVTTDYLVGLGN